jgi:hypothetical protein
VATGEQRNNRQKHSQEVYLEGVRRNIKLFEANEVIKMPGQEVEVVGLQIQHLQLPEKPNLPNVR